VEWLNGAQDFWNEYYPIMLTIGGSILAIVSGLILAWSQIKIYLTPVLDWIKERKDKDNVEEVKNVVNDKLKVADLEIKIQDLREKINNPTTSDEGKRLYQTQLEILLEIKIKLENGLAIVEDTTSKF